MNVVPQIGSDLQHPVTHFAAPVHSSIFVHVQHEVYSALSSVVVVLFTTLLPLL